MDEQQTTTPPDSPRSSIVRSLLRPFRQSPAPRPDRPVEVSAAGEDAGVEAVVPLSDAHIAAQVRANYEAASNTFDEYRSFILALERIADLEILPVRDFADARSDDRRLLALRHDVDGDPVTALRLARFLASRGIGGSFYLLPTAAYYGQVLGSVFVRNPALATWVRGLVVAGCEIGIHNDALATFLEHGIEPAAALGTEIEWLRSIGAVICGSVAHNSAPAYGAANSEVFIGRKLWPREPLSHDGRPLPVESVDEGALGLHYEGTFAAPKARVDAEAARRFCYDREGGGLRSETWMRRFLLDNPTCDWSLDLQAWVIGRNEWVIAGRLPDGPVFEWCVGRRRVIETIAAAPVGSRCLVVLHPEYFLR